MASHADHLMAGSDNLDSDGVSIMEDRRNNPGKSKKAIKAARGLWARGIVEITYKNGDGTRSISRYISRKTGCALSGRLNALLPTERSWPILSWNEVIDDMWKFDFWKAIDNFLAFAYTGSDSHLGNFKANGTPDLAKPDGVFYWCMGQALACPKLQNAAMTWIMKLDSYWERVYSEHDSSQTSFHNCKDTYQDGVLCGPGIFFIAHQHLENYGLLCAPHESESSFRKHKLMSYLVDRLILEAKEGGTLWLHHVHNGGCLASMVAQGMVESAYCTAFRLTPWHTMNREMYLVEE